METPSDSADSSIHPRGLELRIAVRGSSAVLTLHNGGPAGLDVLSCVEAGDRHYDWFTITLIGNAETRVLHLYDDRNESDRVVIHIEPGQDVEHIIDVVEWAKRKANASRPLAPGIYRMSSTYEVSESGPLWNGKLVSPTVSITIP